MLSSDSKGWPSRISERLELEAYLDLLPDIILLFLIDSDGRNAGHDFKLMLSELSVKLSF